MRPGGECAGSQCYTVSREDPLIAAIPPLAALLVDFMAQFSTRLPDQQKSLLSVSFEHFRIIISLQVCL